MRVDSARADRVCRVFSNVIDDVIATRAVKRAFGEDMSPAQFAGLQYVYLHPHCCIRDMAHGLGVSHPAAVKLVERLTAKDFIARSGHEQDKRMVELVVTELGSDKASSAVAIRKRSIATAVRQANGSTSRDLLECLEAFIQVALSDEKDIDGVCLRCGGSHKDECPVCQAELTLTGRARTDN